jgi:hypothetical protein
MNHELRLQDINKVLVGYCVCGNWWSLDYCEWSSDTQHLMSDIITGFIQHRFHTDESHTDRP